MWKRICAHDSGIAKGFWACLAISRQAGMFSLRLSWSPFLIVVVICHLHPCSKKLATPSRQLSTLYVPEATVLHWSGALILCVVLRITCGLQYYRSVWHLPAVID